jgi:elongation factor G
MTGATDRLGRVADGTTVSDFDSEEIRRKISIADSAMFCEYGGVKINIIDTPGYFDFAGEVAQALRVADAGIVVCSAKDGLNVGAEKAWKALTEAKKPRAIFISRSDEENANYDRAFSSLREKFGVSVCPMVAPIVENEKITGLIEIATRKAYQFDAKGKRGEIPVPESMQAELSKLYNTLAEGIAETSEELMDKYFGGEAFTQAEMSAALGEGLRDGSICPVFCGSALTFLGVSLLLDAIVSYFPTPHEGADPVNEAGPSAAVIYKTVSDQYGKFSLFKVVSGKITNDMTLINPRTGTSEKIGHIYVMQGKKNIEVNEISCGDLGAVSKLSDTKTGDTLCAASLNKALPGISYAAPCYAMAIAPKTKGQEDKIAMGLSRLSEEDLTFTYTNNAETHQLVISGAGDIHLDTLCSKLRNKFGVDVVLSPARVPYREKIRGKVKVQGRHKKQSGGHGQFGDVWIEFEPQSETEDLVFAESVFGGAVPKNFFPAVEKGLRESIQKGVLAGYPVVFLKATLVDGSYHPVDSSEMAFKTAASLAYKAGLPKANPVILEPIASLKVTIPDAYMGDIMSDLSKRRGNPMGMSAHDGMQIVEAEVPMAEMGSYAIDLRSMTQGRGSFTFAFVRYEETPAMIQQKIIEEAKALASGDED